MKSMKKLYIIGVVALVLSLVTGLGLVVASGHGTEWGRGFHCGRGPGQVLSRMDSHVETLHLTAAQRAKYDEIRAGVKRALIEGMEDRGMLKQEIRSELNKKTPDMHVVSGMLKKRITNVSGFFEENLDLLVAFYDMLDEKQKAKVIEHLREKMDSTEG